MLKQLISGTALAVVLLSSSAQANTKEVPRDGFYVGLMTGLSHFTSNGQFTTPIIAAGAPPNPIFTAQIGEQSNLSSNSLKTGFFAGYEENFSNNVLVAGQITYSYNTLDVSQSIRPTVGGVEPVFVKQSHTYGAALKVGAPCHDSIALYATLGVVNSQFTLGYSPVNTTAGPGGTKDKNSWGISPGVELKIGLTRHLSLHTSLTYTIYQTITANVSGTRPSNLNGRGPDIYKITPRMADILIGFSYKI